MVGKSKPADVVAIASSHIWETSLVGAFVKSKRFIIISPIMCVSIEIYMVRVGIVILIGINPVC